MPDTNTQLKTSRHSQHSTTWRPVAIIAIVIFSLNLLVTQVILPMSNRHMDYHDFYPIIAASQAIREGNNPYEHGVVGDQIQTFRPGHPVASGYLYPTFWAHVVTPLSYLPPIPAQRIWHIFNVLFTVGIFWIGIHLFAPKGQRIYAWAFALGVFTLFKPIYETMLVGQTNLFIALMIALGVFFAAKKRPWLAGIALGVGAMVKLWPLVVLFYFLLRWNWKVLLASAATAVILIGGSFAITGPDLQKDYFLTRLPETIFEGNTKPISSIHNVSLRGLVHRAFTTEAEEAQAGGQRMKFQPEHLVAGSVDQVGTPFLLITVLLLGGISWLTFRRRSEPGSLSPERLAIDTGLFLTFLALFSAFFTEHYLVLFILPFVALYSSSAIRNHLQQHSYLVWMTGVAFALIGFFINEDYYRLWEDSVVGSLLFQPQTYGLLLLFVVLATVSYQLRISDRTTDN